MNQEYIKSWIIYIVAAVALGVGIGYWYGLAEGEKRGREHLLAEQQVAEEAARIEAQQQLVEAANPFSDAASNPLEEGYENPFKANTNPFE